MKTLTFAVLFIAFAAHADDSALVKAAKASGGPKKKSTKKVITNADVKKSTGKLTELPGAKATITLTTDPTKTPQQKQDEQRRASEAAASRVSEAQTKVTQLEAELARIEQSYYEASDPNYRDTTIKQRFDRTKQQLDEARKELADAREVQKKVTKPSS